MIALGDDPRVAGALASLPATTDEVLLVENGAEGPGQLSGRAPDIRLRRPENPGFAAAFNEAYALSRAPLILSLNPDARLDPGALDRAREALLADPECGAIALRLLRPGRATLDSAGIRLGPIRRARDRGMGRPADGNFLESERVDAACMAAALFRRSALEAARDGAGEVLDERFFAYKEDVDLGWRLRRAGFSVRYLPAAVAEHERGWREGARRSVPSWIRVLSLRNRWLTMLKNESGFSGLLRMGLCILVEVPVALRLCVTEPRTLAAYPAVLKALGETLRRRRSPTRR